MKQKLIIMALSGVTCLSAVKPSSSPIIEPTITTQSALNEAIAQGMKPVVAEHAWHAYSKALQEGLTRSTIYTIIDYSLPSSRKRLWVLDFKTQKVLFQCFVAHGEKSGFHTPNHFSNRFGSHMTSLGLYLTDKTYYGQYGYSLRLNGLEPGINDHARARAIVMHGASWANRMIQGRSWGCPTVPLNLVKPIAKAIKGGSLMYMYAEDQRYLQRSKFV